MRSHRVPVLDETFVLNLGHLGELLRRSLVDPPRVATDRERRRAARKGNRSGFRRARLRMLRITPWTSSQKSS